MVMCVKKVLRLFRLSKNGWNNLFDYAMLIWLRYDNLR